MSAKTSETLIGLFVVSAVALAVAALAAFGSGMFFTKKLPFIMYFDGAVSGLEVGSPVIFRGVPIGLVKNISIMANASGLSFSVPVLAEITSGKVTLQGVSGSQQGETLLEVRKQTPNELVKALVEKGLRAQLVTQSFVTGQLAVSLDILPNTPARMRGDGSVLEVPTVPSEFEELANTLKTLPLKELAAHLLSAVTGVEHLVNAPETAKIPGKIDTVLTSSTQLVDELRVKADELTKNLDQTVKSYGVLAGNLDQRADKLTVSAKKSLDSLDAALVDGRSVLTKFQKVVNPESPTVTDLNKALSEIALAARSIRALSDYLERHPEALIQGKGGNSSTRR